MFDKEASEILFATAKEMGLQPEWVTGYGLFAIQVNNKTHFISNSTSILNSHISNFIARNKHATRAILEKYNYPNIPYLVPKTLQEVELFLNQHTELIAKPIIGSKSRNVQFITKIETAAKLTLKNFIFEKYIHGKEVRYFVCNDKVLGVFEKVHEGPLSHKIIQRISYPTSAWNEELMTKSLSLCKLVSLRFAAVDWMIDAENTAYVLEINSSPGMKRMQKPDKGTGIDVFKLFLEESLKEYQRIEE